MSKNFNLSNIIISNDFTHHIHNSKPLYNNRYHSVGKFHEPGLAPASNNSGYFHISTKGLPAYKNRFDKTFGFYCDIATAIMNGEWLHINKFGETIHDKTFDWSGNFQENFCVVKSNGVYYHITSEGKQLYKEKFDYVGDFKDGIAVIYKGGKSTHINTKGELLHCKWFKQLGIYHKGFAVAEDENGWFHIDQHGNEIYQTKFKFVEPFYNDFARVETFCGKFLQIDTNGHIFNIISDNSKEVYKSIVSDYLVGFWKTQILYSAAYLNIFNKLPSTIEELSYSKKIPKSNLLRLLKALQELTLIKKEKDLFSLTEKGEIFIEFSYLQDAAIMWGKVSHQNWKDLPKLLSQKEVFSHSSFKETETNSNFRKHYQKALNGYLREDINSIKAFIDTSHNNILCLGQPSEILIKSLKNDLPKLNITSELSTSNNATLCIFLKHLLHFDDKKVASYLAQMKNAGTQNILIIETLISNNDPKGGMLDINMLIESGGKLRTSKEYKQLLEEKDYSIKLIKNINSYLQIIFAENNYE